MENSKKITAAPRIGKAKIFASPLAKHFPDSGPVIHFELYKKPPCRLKKVRLGSPGLQK
jgi:hypothetical protein